jgi:hypothetical protein
MRTGGIARKEDLSILSIDLLLSSYLVTYIFTGRQSDKDQLEKTIPYGIKKKIRT